MAAMLRSPARWPLRLRVAASFASVVAAVLLVASGLLYVQFGHDLQGRIDEELSERQVTFVGLAKDRSPTAVLTIAGEPFAQIYRADGTVIASTRRITPTPSLTSAQVQRALKRPLAFTRATLPNTGEGARLRAFAVRGSFVAVIAEPLDTRQAELHRLAALLALTMPLALLLASAGGYRVAGLALRPVEAMRERAARIGAGDLHERLPEPPTGDELQRLAVTLNELLGRLGDAIERERRIVGDASHELRTPISVLRTRAQVALRGTDDGLRDALVGVEEDAERLSQLADDLLVLARFDQGQLPLRLEPLDAWDIATRAAERAWRHGTAIELRDRTAGGAVVLGDAGRIEQLLDNLIQNAERYGQPQIVLEVAVDGDSVVLTVSDAGGGFPPEFLPKAFDRFSQADPSHGGGGAGLGLAIVEAIATAHGGTATAGASPAGGARVMVHLPRA
jgi:two-component system OmpR family sensor kinase